MARYSTADYMTAWAKGVAFALVLAIAFGITFNSFFLFLITMAFFFFIPNKNEERELGYNALLFAFIMVLTLILGGLDPPWGLGFEVGGTFAQQWGSVLFILVFSLFGLSFIGSIPSPLDKIMGDAKVLAWILLILTSAVIVIWLQPWTWSTVAVLFAGFWLIASLGGASGDIAARNVLGAVFVTMAVIVFATQAGTQVVGELAFGEWWPTLAQSGSQVLGPLSETFTQLSGTAGMGLQLLVSPTAFAQRIMAGQYTRDPTTGLVGAFGVEIEELRTTPIFVEQPYTVLFRVKNKGSYDADIIALKLYVGEKPPTAEKYEFEPIPGVPISRMYSPKVPIEMKQLGFSTRADINQTCTVGERSHCLKLVDEMPQLDVRQEFFESSGINCTAVVKYDLLKKYTPLIGEVRYDYKIASSLGMEFMANTEWDRLVKAGELVTQRKRPASLSNAPVRLDIDALEQPIREGTPFFIGLYLNSSQVGGIVKDPKIELTVPQDLIDNLRPETCTVRPTQIGNKLIWDFTNKTFFLVLCQFKPVNQSDLVGDPTKTFLFTANASYIFLKAKAFISKIEFGGIVCCKKDADCAQYNQTCDTTINKCKAREAPPAVPPEEPAKGSADWCAWKIANMGKTPPGWDTRIIFKCLDGQGGCKTGECDDRPTRKSLAGEDKKLKCRTDIGLNVCCFEDDSFEACNETYHKWAVTEEWHPDNIWPIRLELTD